MIAKRVPRNKGTSSVARLVRYMVAAQGGLDPKSWARTVDYILDTKEKTPQGERVGSYSVTNCGTDDPAAATVLIEATQTANTRSKTDKTYHLVFSFSSDEQPPLDVLHAIEDELCASIGYADHHRVSAVHTDTDHLHVHVAINKVHPTGLQNIEPYYDKKRLMEACERLEIKYGLQRTNHGLQKDKDHDKTDQIRLAPEQRPEQRDSRFRQYLRESYDLSLAEPPKTETLNGLRKLSGCRMAHSTEGTALLLQGDARSRVEQGGTERVNGLRRARHDHRADVGDERKIKASTVDIEVQSGLETLTGYVAREVAPLLRKAMSWKEIHSKAAEHGLEVNRRGAGLVIGDPGLSLWTKASTCGRDLSFKALTDRLGSFEPSRQHKEQAAKSYTPRPCQENPASASLFARYRHERQENIMARRGGLAQMKRDDERFKAQLQQWRNTQRMMLKVSARGATRKVMQSIIKRQADASRVAYRKVMDERRHMLFVQTSMPAWADWLIVQAEKGEPDALAVLRSREKRERRWHGDLLTAALADKAKTVVMESLNPQARKDGTMVYRIVDGGIVIDRTTHVQAQKTTTGAALVMLELAAQKFEGHALIVEGTAGFRQVVAQLAGLHDLDIRFADPAMEQARQTAVDMKIMELRWQDAINPGKHPSIDRTKPGKDTASPAGSSGTVEKWIEERNKKRDNISSIDYHRFWTPGDVGKAIYQGRRRMADGTEVLLLKRGCEILVKPSSSYVVVKAAKWKRGRCVQLDAHGRFIGGGNGVEL
ncbi:TraI/MobA(P) family conjugative relaxase [Xenorhabdus bovienii]|uniref:TraI/MobA(P) family conjugative relaxase n=1 Tax=Xenorhabdus bovienii TaxID=40576 RepID=UPI0021574B5A|nr:TraI/MobA(P) family conjugative relaxase [Xenorhabdus bovienii]